MIVFENIETGETVGIRQEEEGFMAEAKISALVNSSNMGINAARGQDFGWRLGAEHQATLEEWKEDAQMVEKVSRHTSVAVDDLTDAHFLRYMLYIENTEAQPRKMESKNRDDAEQQYRERVRAAASGSTKKETSSRVKEQEDNSDDDEATVKSQTRQTQEQPSAPRTQDPKKPAEQSAKTEKSTSESSKTEAAKTQGAKNVQSRDGNGSTEANKTNKS